MGFNSGFKGLIFHAINKATCGQKPHFCELHNDFIGVGADMASDVEVTDEA